jgi:hypothetical protein
VLKKWYNVFECWAAVLGGCGAYGNVVTKAAGPLHCWDSNIYGAPPTFANAGARYRRRSNWSHRSTGEIAVLALISSDLIKLQITQGRTTQDPVSLQCFVCLRKQFARVRLGQARQRDLTRRVPTRDLCSATDNPGVSNPDEHTHHLPLHTRTGRFCNTSNLNPGPLHNHAMRA